MCADGRETVARGTVVTVAVTGICAANVLSSDRHGTQQSLPPAVNHTLTLANYYLEVILPFLNHLHSKRG